MDWSIIGYLATIFGSIQLVPEVKKALQTHHLKDLAWGMLLLMLTSSILWVLYGIYLQSYPIIISGTLNVSMELTLIVIKAFFVNKPNWTPPLKPKDIRIKEGN